MLDDDRTPRTQARSMSPKRKSLWTPAAEQRPRVVNGVFEAGARYRVVRDGPERRVLVIDSDKERIVAATPLAVGCTVKTRHATLVDIAFTRPLRPGPASLCAANRPNRHRRHHDRREHVAGVPARAPRPGRPRADQDRRLAPPRKDLPGRRDRPGHPLTAESGTSRRPKRPRVPERPLLVS